MEVYKKLTKAIKERFKSGGVIAFASFGHGMGRSYVKKKIAEALNRDSELGKRVVLLSTGDIFREMSKKLGFNDINEFARFLEENPGEAERIDTEIDRKVMLKIRELVKKGMIVLVDSNLHAWPHALEGLPFITFVIYARPEVVGKRLVEKQRKGEKKYSSPEEAVEAQVKRTREDIARYLRLAGRVRDRELRCLYERGARRLAKALFTYRLILWNGLSARPLLKTVGPSAHVIDNSGDIKKTLEQVVEKL